MSKPLRLILAIAVCLFVACRLAFGQPSVDESRPSIYYLPDKQGNLQPVLDFPYEDFAELYKLKHRLDDRERPPRYTIESMTASGTASGTYAQLKIEFQVRLREDGWVGVPLRLDQGLLAASPTAMEDGEAFVQSDSQGEGYVAWIRAKQDATRRIALSMIVPLTNVGDETRLKLSSPRAAKSELTLTVPTVGAVGSVSEGAMLLPATKSDGTTSEFRATGLGGAFQLTWHKPRPGPTESPVVLEAQASVLARMDARGVTAEAALTVRSNGGSFDRFTVRLPPGAELSGGSPSGYVVAPAAQTGTDRPSDQRRVEVRFAKKTTGPVEVRLACHRDYNPRQQASWCELAGFEVVDAPRQSGVIAVAAPAEWQVLWGDGSDAHAIDTLPEALRKDDVVAGFEYSGQPYKLSARLTPKKSHIGVESNYVVLVGRDELRLEGTLGYVIRGPKIASLALDMADWELDELGPDATVADEATTKGSQLAIPLLRPTSGAVEIRLRAHRTRKPDDVRVHIDVPRPLGGATGSVAVAVVPADNVELTPDVQATKGLVRQVAPVGGAKMPERQQPPLYYRGADEPAEFVAGVRVHRQSISVDVSTQVALSERSAEIEQRQSYSVLYEPVDQLTILLNRTLAAPKRIQVFCDGKPLVSIPVANDSGDDDAAGPTAFRVALPGPRIGVCELVLRYSAAVAAPRPDHPSTLALSVPMPGNASVATNTLLVKPGDDFRVVPLPGAWAVAANDAGDSDSPAALRLSAAKPASSVELRLEAAAEDATETTIIERLWLQTWLTTSARQDRAVCQVSTNRRAVEVELPDGAAVDRAEVFVDGTAVAARVGSAGRLQIPLTARRERGHATLELRYPFADARPPRGAMQLEFPRIGRRTWTQQAYWQLILPINEHVLGSPDGMSGEFAWKWHDYFWGRQPSMGQADLEAWAGAAPWGIAPDNVNTYLYGAIGNIERADLRTADRAWIVLGASGAALAAGLLLIYLRRLRHPATLLAATLVLMAAGLIAPEPTLVLAQAAGLGLVLALSAALLHRGLATRWRRRRFIRPEAATPLFDSAQSSHTRRRAPAGGGSAVTESLPAAVPPSLGGIEP